MSGAITATTVAVAAMTTAEIFTAVAITGAVVGAVGAVTHIKELQYAGMAMGVVGGIGGLAVGAGLFAGEAGAGLFEGSAGALGEGFATSAAGPVSGAAFDGAAGALGEGFQVSAAPSDVINSITAKLNIPGDTVLSGDTATDPLVTVPQSPPNVAPVAATDTGAASPAATNPNAATDAATWTGAPVSPAVSVTGVPAPLAPRVPPGLTADGMPIPPPSDPSVWDNIMKLADTKAAGPLAYGAIQAGSAFLSGATSSLTPAQVAALNAQADANRAAANLANTQQANLASGVPVATRTAVTGVPAGMINTSPKPLGAPA